MRLRRKDSDNDDDGPGRRDGEAGLGCGPDDAAPRPLQISVRGSPSSGWRGEGATLLVTLPDMIRSFSLHDITSRTLHDMFLG